MGESILETHSQNNKNGQNMTSHGTSGLLCRCMPAQATITTLAKPWIQALGFTLSGAWILKHPVILSVVSETRTLIL